MDNPDWPFVVALAMLAAGVLVIAWICWRDV